MDIKTAKLGEFSHKELKEQCKAIYGGVAWPGEGPGFAVVIGTDKEKHFDSHDIYLLDEFESMDVRELVRQCGVLDFKYQPKRWIGDNKNDAADRFIREMNDEFADEVNENFLSESDRRRLYVCSTQILDMKCPYQFILAELKQLLNKERRQLFLKDSKIGDYLGGIEPSQISTLEFGAFPAIEALAFAVIEMRLLERQSEAWPESTEMAESYTVKSAFR